MTDLEACLFLLTRRDNRGRPSVEYSAKRAEAAAIVTKLLLTQKVTSTVVVAPVDLTPDPLVREALKQLGPGADW